LRAFYAHDTEKVSRRHLECPGVPGRHLELGNYGQLSAGPVVKTGVERRLSVVRVFEITGWVN
jgi:hypothetical protein